MLAVRRDHWAWILVAGLLAATGPCSIAQIVEWPDDGVTIEGGEVVETTPDAAMGEAVPAEAAQALAPTEPTVGQGITLELIGPTNLEAKRPTRFRVRVLNPSASPSEPFDLEANFGDPIRVVASLPAPKVVGRKLIWRVESIHPQDRRDILFDAIRETAGEMQIEVAARPTLKARMGVIDPSLSSLRLKIEAPSEAPLHKTFDAKLLITNRGAEPISNGGLSLDHSRGLKLKRLKTSASGPFTLKPGETLTAPIELESTESGLQGLKATAEADGGVHAEIEHRVRVLAPRLAVDFLGPGDRAVGALADYVLTISNPSETPTEKVYAFIELPREMRYLSADENAVFDPARNLIYWWIPNLSPGQRIRLRVTARGEAAGAVKIRGSSKDEAGTAAEGYVTTRVRGEPVGNLPMAWKETPARRTGLSISAK